MAQSFKTGSGIKSFGVFKESMDAGDYINNKTAKTTFCNPNICKPSRTVNTQGNLLLLQQSNKLTFYKDSYSSFSKSNLNMNLITKLDLTDVPVIQNNNPPFEVPTDITVGATPYLDYNIDPSGFLFGNTTCGLYNYLDYIVYNPPYSTTDPGHINRD
jgi:hypothetical protein